MKTPDIDLIVNIALGVAGGQIAMYVLYFLLTALRGLTE